MKKKILFISESMGGGLRKHVVQLIENLDSKKFDLYFIHGLDGLDETFINSYSNLQKRCKMIACPYLVREINFYKDLKSIKFVLKQISIIKPDIVHCHSSKAGAIGRIAAKMKSVNKIFYTPHAYSFLAPEFSNTKRKIFVLIEKYLSKYTTTKTFNVSQGEKVAALSMNLDLEHKFSVIYNGLPNIEFPDKNFLKEKLSLNLEWFVIGNNARLSEQKNPMLFMEIAKKIIAIDHKIHFVWVGEGPLLDKIESFIMENNLTSNIHLLGFREDSEIIVKAYDIFLLTSEYEGLPYAPIEALRAGVPVLATDVTGNSEVVISEINGYLFNKKNIDEAIYYIKNLKKDPLKSNKIKKEFNAWFSLNKMIEHLTNEYIN